MPHKVIVSGNIIEVYHYQKEPVNNLDNTDKVDDFDPFDYENTKVELEDRTHERRLQTVRDARNITRRLALMNFTNSDKFITLTYKENMIDLNKADDDFKKFIKRFKYRFKIQTLKYIAVREKQKRGAIHFHLICDWKRDFDSEEDVKHFERVLGSEIWKHGFVDIKQIDHVDNVGAYIIKYMTKNLSVEIFKNKKLYLCSKGLERPIVYRGVNAEALIDTYNLGQKKEVFTNSYESEYLGTVTYKEYNLSRL